MTLWPFLLGLIGLTILSLIYVAIRPSAIRAPGGTLLGIFIVFLGPALALYGGASAQFERSKSTSFCLSCHAMQPYGKSLLVDDKEFIPAQHFQNNRMPREHACYTCHTNYALFGGVRSKFRGLRHIFVNYFGTIPDTIKLYTPFNNRECLHCHLGGRPFEESQGHQSEDAPIADIKSGKISCVSAGCHDVVHNVHELEGEKFWTPLPTAREGEW
jgi:cytochrome c-type protein NapC